ncbi:MAG TPA: hypothetical protein DCW29_15975 [Janthinobacterium sp.]|nr:hypothetical protein [Janthinobacterium sp.]
MLQQIISHTPLYVWALLAFLVYRGVLASREREVAIGKIAIIPLVMLGLSLQGISSAFGMEGVAPVIWLSGALAGGALIWRLIDPARIAADPARGVIRLRGSWAPLVSMLSLFCMKYVVAVSMALNPSLRHEAAFMATICALYGVFNGAFIGGLLRNWAGYRQAQAGVTTPAHAPTL